MLINTRGNAFWFAVYFLFSVCIGVLVRDISGQPDLFATAENFMAPESVTKLNDSISFVSGAMEIYHHGWVQPQSQWLVKLWPPGFMATEGLIFKLFGIDAPFIFILLLLNAALVALMLSLMRVNALAVTSPLVAALLPIVPFAFPVTRLFLLQPSGIVLGEGLSIALFMTSMLLVPMAVRRRSLPLGACAGLALALAAYFRSQFELLVVLLTLGAVLLVVVYFLFFRKRLSDKDRQHINYVIKTVAVMLFSAHMVMAPWRIHNLYEPSTGNTSWVQTKILVFTNAGKTDQELIDAGGEWIVLGGGNVACKVEPSYCGKSEEGRFYEALMHHPVEWIAYKAAAFPDYWFSSLKNFTLIRYPATAVGFVTNFLLLVLVFLNIFLLLKIRRHPDFPVYFWQCLSFYACSFSIFLLVHYETRYFYALKIYGAFTFFTLLPVAWNVLKSPRINGLSKNKTWFRYE